MKQTKPHISVVSPVYRAEKIVSELVRQLHENLQKITTDYEIILVNDASPDNSWFAIAAECEKDKRVKGIDLSRNFGQHYAITAGLYYAKGDWTVVMDCDLQDRPDEILNLYQKAQEGWDIVYARRTERQDKFMKRIFSKWFWHILSYLSGIKQNNVANYGIYHSKVITEYNKMKEYARSFATLIKYLGFRSCVIDVRHAERFEGKSSYTLAKLLRLAMDVTLSTSNKPLKLTVKCGFIISLLSFLLALYNILAKFAGIIQVAGYTTTVFSIWFVGGLILFVLGIIGLYIGKIFDQVKERQLFIVSKTLNIENIEKNLL
ncbi:MAG: glycosyltransferase family 2 protein [Flavobacteriaceae bacterium]|jgi:dolichol-phosphate mannosyltransferase|nr:glycosyltransferase family 2 protein [Flavobacteriaceae bacterium]